MSIVRDRPAYAAARAWALRCLQQKRKGQHGWSVGAIAFTSGTEWGLDESEMRELAALLSKAQT